MKLYQLHSKQTLPISQEKAWDFLSNPSNLKIITPARMGFQIISGAGITMYPGQIIQYSVSPFSGYHTRWVTEITHIIKGEYFVDEQRFGPYQLWQHKHFIKEVPNGIVMEDIIDYKLPFGIIGSFLHRFIVKKQLMRIFDYRETKLKELFGGNASYQSELHFKSL